MRTPSPKRSPRTPPPSEAKIKVRPAKNTIQSPGVFSTLSRAAAKLTDYMSPSKRPLPNTPTGKTMRVKMANMTRKKVRNNAKARLHVYEYNNNKSVAPRKISFQNNNRIYNNIPIKKTKKNKRSLMKKLTRRSRRVAPAVLN